MGIVGETDERSTSKGKPRNEFGASCPTFKRGLEKADATARGPRALQFTGGTAIHPESFRGRERRDYKEARGRGPRSTLAATTRQGGAKHVFLRNEPKLCRSRTRCIILR
jgi:hypothetical protein